MLAALLSEFGSPVEITEIPAPTPGDGELLVRVEATGVCGTDLHILSGNSYRPTLPFVLGHEPCGVVADTGFGVDSSWLGRRVVPSIFEGCGLCMACRNADERLCAENRSILGVSERPGGFAEFVTFPARLALEVPPSLDSHSAAALVDAGPTAVNAIRALSASGSPATVLIAGGGPVGWLIAQFARAEGIRPTVAEPSPARNRALAEAGFETLSSVGDLDDPVEFAIDAAGAPGLLSELIEAIRPSGTLVVVGYHASDSISTANLARRELSLRGVRSGRKADLNTAIAAADTGFIDLPEVSVWSLRHIQASFEALTENRITGKVVIDIGGHNDVMTGRLDSNGS